MNKYENNILEYSKHYLNEYKYILENNYKEILDKLKTKEKIKKYFKLYYLKELIPYGFMYDYGTRIYFVKLSKPKILIKYDDKIYNKEWANIYTEEKKEEEILKLLNIKKSDIIDSVIVEGCPFLKDENLDDIISNAKSHSRNELKNEIFSYQYKNQNFLNKLLNIFKKYKKRNVLIFIIIIIIIFFLGFFVGNFDRLKYIKKIKIFNFEIEFSEKYIENKK